MLSLLTLMFRLTWFSQEVLPIEQVHTEQVGPHWRGGTVWFSNLTLKVQFIIPVLAFGFFSLLLYLYIKNCSLSESRPQQAANCLGVCFLLNLGSLQI